MYLKTDLTNIQPIMVANPNIPVQTLVYTFIKPYLKVKRHKKFSFYVLQCILVLLNIETFEG